MKKPSIKKQFFSKLNIMSSNEAVYKLKPSTNLEKL